MERPSGCWRKLSASQSRFLGSARGKYRGLGRRLQSPCKGLQVVLQVIEKAGVFTLAFFICIRYNGHMESKIPNVGATVKVVTRYKNSYIYTADEQPFVYHTREGTVLPSNKWDQPNTFNMTGDSAIAVRNINISNVESLEILTGSARAAISGAARVFRVKSKNKSYIVTFRDGKFNCDCLGFQFRRNCRHTNGVAAKLKAK